MRGRAVGTALVVSVIALTVAAQGTLPKDVHPESRNRLPTGGQGATEIRKHGSGVAVRWSSRLGRQLTELAIITTAREHDQPYEWSLHELEAVAVGLDPSVIDIVRHRKPLGRTPEREATIIQLGREIFGSPAVSSETYAHALKLFGESNLVDVVDLMSNYTSTSAVLSAFNQQMPAGWKQFLPLPFTLPSDVHEDSRNRLALMKGPATPFTDLYSRGIAPEGTGPGQIRRHGAGLATLDKRVGRRTMALAALVTAREHNAEYDWTISELAAAKDGLEPSTVDMVRLRKPVATVGEKDAALITVGRALFSKHYLTPETYAQAVKAFGETDLVDLVGLMGQHAGDAAILKAFDQQLPASQKPLLNSQ